MNDVQTSNPTAGQFQNPGYEHLKSIYLLKEAQAKAPLKAASAYILPLMALQSACLAIDEYINLTLGKIDPGWYKDNRPSGSIKKRIKHVYKITEQPLCLNAGIWKEMLTLFITVGLLEGDLTKMKKLQIEEIPENFKSIATEYPIKRSQAIAEEVIDLLLEQSAYSSSGKGNSN